MLPFLVFSVSDAKSTVTGHITLLTGSKGKAVEPRLSKPPSCTQHRAPYTAGSLSRGLLSDGRKLMCTWLLSLASSLGV